MNQYPTTPYDQQQSMARINDIDLHYALEGEPDKPVLALINMASHNLTCWEIVLQSLLERYQVLRFDLRGTGRSGWGDEAQFNFAQYADDLAGLLKHLNIQKLLYLASLTALAQRLSLPCGILTSSADLACSTWR